MAQNLPAYIKPRTDAPNLAQRGLQNVGSPVGPYVSIKGNRFTLVDAAGNLQPIQTLHLDACVVDINDHLSKMFYGSDFDEENPVPPTCWSDNGLAPSSAVSAENAQSILCANCPQNVWGSKVSNMGSEVKACRDEQKIAVIIPGMPNNVFRLTVPPNSLANKKLSASWRGYLAKFQNAGFDVADVITRITFAQGVNGTLEFNPAPNPWLDAATVQVRDSVLAQKTTDAIVGRLDRPRQGALPAPAVEQARPLPAASSATSAGFPLAATAPPPTQTAPPATVASPSDPPAAGKRRRRTQAEIAADNAKQASPASGGQGPAMAPFRPEAQPNGGSPTAGGPPFGVGPGVAPDPKLQADLDSIFGKA